MEKKGNTPKKKVDNTPEMIKIYQDSRRCKYWFLICLVLAILFSIFIIMFIIYAIFCQSAFIIIFLIYQNSSSKNFNFWIGDWIFGIGIWGLDFGDWNLGIEFWDGELGLGMGIGDLIKLIIFF